jgi:hypothetical protein
VDYYPATNYGTLLTTALTGDGNTIPGSGGNSRKLYVTTATGTQANLYYTGSSGSTTGAGYLHYFFTYLGK